MRFDAQTLDALRMRKEVQISKTMKVIVKEFTAAEVFEMFSFEKLPRGDSLAAFQDQLGEFLPKCLEGIDLEGLKQLPPSKIKEIWTAFKECNSVFFEAAQQMGLGALVERLKSAFASDFGRIFANSLRQVTASLPGTDTRSS